MFDFLKAHCLILCELSDFFQTLTHGSVTLPCSGRTEEERVNKSKQRCGDALPMDSTHPTSKPFHRLLQ